MNFKEIKTGVKAMGLRATYNFIDKNPKKNMKKVGEFMKKNIPNGPMDIVLNPIAEVLSNEESNWYQFAQSVWNDIDSDIRRTLLENMVINGNLIWAETHDELTKKYDCNIPWTILIDPTSACNLKCTGCWASEYGNSLNMSYDELDSIIKQANELGVYFFLFSGGEPLTRKKDIIRLCENHPDCEFSAFTNGTLIDDDFISEMLRVKNFVPAISVEGFENDTDFRRGQGTFKKVENAMRLLRENRLLFGISCCYTSKNCEMIGSEEYFDQMIEWGAKFCWFFTYMPVGNKAVPDLMVSAEQREFMYNQVRKFRETKPIFTLDFWNDGEYPQGCVAGGRVYLHINANGDYEPCAFIHYSNANIHDSTLLEALQSPLFMEYKNRQPFNENHLRPCPLLDNPDELEQMVVKSNAHSTDLESPENIHKLCDKCREKAEKWSTTADEIWNCKCCVKY